MKASSQASERKAFFDLGRHGRVFVWPRGVSVGKGPGGRGIYCKYVIQKSGIELRIVDRLQEHESRPSVFVRIGSLALMELGLDNAWEVAKDLLELLGFSMTRNVPARVDPCIDLADVAPGEFASAVGRGEVVTRGRKGAQYWDGQHVTGFTVGKGAVVLRVYDKVGELLGGSRENQRKADYLQRNRWGKACDVATRVEFQLRRSFLRDVGVNSFDDLVARLPQIVRYLTREWFRIVEAGAADLRKNHNIARAKMSALWERVCEAFEQWAGQVQGPWFERREPGEPKIENLAVQALGCMASAAAARGQVFDDVGELLAWAVKQLRELPDKLTGRALRRLQERVIVQEAEEPPGWAALQGVPF